METTRGAPSVRVPVLSKTTVLILWAVSRASALRIKMPCIAPRPMPTITAVGVASPRAHGQAITSTATVISSAFNRRGSGAAKAQTT